MIHASQLIHSGILDLGVEYNDIRDEEERNIIPGGCSCRHGKGKTPCHKLFSAFQYRVMRDKCREPTQDKLDLGYMGALPSKHYVGAPLCPV